MDQRVSFITLAVADTERSKAFYADGLGWSPEFHVPDEVVFFRVGPHLVLSLWRRSGFEEEVGPIGPGPGLAPMTLAHNVRTRAEVESVLETAARAGAEVVGEATDREWGGYTGYFADPDGFRWEVAFNPGPIGQTVLPDAG